jgi:hypothetical protein
MLRIVFTFKNIRKKAKRRLNHDAYKLYEIQTSVFKNKIILEHSYAHSFA